MGLNFYCFIVIMIKVAIKTIQCSFFWVTAWHSGHSPHTHSALEKHFICNILGH